MNIQYTQMCALGRCIHRRIDEHEREKKEKKRKSRMRVYGHDHRIASRAIISQLFCFLRQAMVRAKFISLSRIWYTILIVIVHLILLVFGMKQYLFNDRLIWPKSSSSSPMIELLVQKICLITSSVLLVMFIYPALFQIGNLPNDHHQLTIRDLTKTPGKKAKISLCLSLWHHCFSLSSTLHLLMSFLLIISTVLIDAKQILVGLKDSGRSNNHVNQEK